MDMSFLTPQIVWVVLIALVLLVAALVGSPSGKVRNGGDAKSLHAARHPRAPARPHVPQRDTSRKAADFKPKHCLPRVHRDAIACPRAIGPPSRRGPARGERRPGCYAREMFSRMRGVMSAPVWMSRHS